MIRQFLDHSPYFDSMTGRKKVGILVSATPGSSEFSEGLVAAEEAVKSDSQLYLYLIDGAVEGVTDPRFASLKERGAHLFACAYSLQHRGLNAPEGATLSGLTVLSDIMSSTDSFLSFN